MIIIFWAFLPDDDRAYAVDPMQKLCHLELSSLTRAYA